MGGMTWNQMDEPVFYGTEDFREVVEDYAATTAELIEAIRETAENEAECIWRPHLAQLQAALAHFETHCREAIENATIWSEDGSDLDKIYSAIWEEGTQLVHWLRRMLGIS